MDKVSCRGNTWSSFFAIYFPLITHTYNEVLLNSPRIWPSLTGTIYFKMTDEIGMCLIPPCMIMGVLGTAFTSKILSHKEKLDLVTSKTV